MEKKRLLFIDILRSLAVFAMIETHVVNSIMRIEFRNGELFNTINIMNGFVSVAFLFLSGATFTISISKKLKLYKKLDKSLWIYLRKLSVILLIAYGLHLPVFSLSGLGDLSREQMLFFFNCDVLQNIVYTSLIALVVALLTPNYKHLKYIYSVLAFAFIVFSPLVWQLNATEHIPIFFGAIVSGPEVSGFGLFPWSGYFLAGAAFTQFFFEQENKVKLSILALPLCAIVVILSFATSEDLITYFAWDNWWNGFPTHTLFRLASMIGFFCIAYLIEQILPKSLNLKYLTLSGKESLMIYIGHLLFLYGIVVNLGFNYLFGPRRDYIEVAVITVLLCVLFYYLAFVWNTIKTHKPKIATYSLLSLGIVIFSVLIIL